MNINDVKTTGKDVFVELGGRKRRLVFDMNAFGVLEQRFGTVEAAMTSLEQGKLGDVKVLLWAAMIHDEVTSFDEETGEPTGYNITPYQVGAWIHSPAMLQELMMQLGRALSQDMPASDTEGKS